MARPTSADLPLRLIRRQSGPPDGTPVPAGGRGRPARPPAGLIRLAPGLRECPLQWATPARNVSS
jgi:hypothetical protein